MYRVLPILTPDEIAECRKIAASAPFVATPVDVTGVVIYFSTATMILTGVVL